MNILKLALFLIAGLLMCPARSGETENFRFPGGSPARGKAAFEKMDCIRCHVIEGAGLREPEGKRWLSLSLGAETRFVKKYQDIITAIANPQHVVDKQYQTLINQAEVRAEINAYMPDFTAEMSVMQLMDLTAFLDKVYLEKNKAYGKQ